MKNPVGDTDRLTQHYHRYSFFQTEQKKSKAID